MEQYTKEQMLEEAKGRGYEIVMHSGDYSWYSLYNEVHKINLQLRFKPHETTFELTYMVGFLKLTTGECGSFMNGVHFFGIQHQMIEAIFKLEGRY